jgi:hypothetical protein
MSDLGYNREKSKPPKSCFFEKFRKVRKNTTKIDIFRLFFRFFSECTENVLYYQSLKKSRQKPDKKTRFFGK